MALKAAVLVFLLLPRVAAADEGPFPPCAGVARPAYSQAGEAPHVQIWRDADLGPDWRPADCASWIATDRKTLIALAARFRSESGVDAVLARFAEVSALSTVRYWSVTDGGWERLITQAYALQGPDLQSQRADFTVEELKSGRDLYFAQKDNRSSNKVIYRMKLREAGPDSFVVEMENVTSVRFYVVTLFPANSLRSLYFLNRPSPFAWDYYSLTGAGSHASILTGSSDQSYVNRATALFRHFAGIPTDGDASAFHER